jgi:hypothetical protein
MCGVGGNRNTTAAPENLSVCPKYVCFQELEHEIVEFVCLRGKI